MSKSSGKVKIQREDLEGVVFAAKMLLHELEFVGGYWLLPDDVERYEAGDYTQEPKTAMLRLKDAIAKLEKA